MFLIQMLKPFFEIGKSVLKEQNGSVIDKVGVKNKNFVQKTSSKFCQSILQKNNPLNTLSDIQNQIVVTPLNKANESVAFVYQRFYAIGLTNELSLDHNNTVTNKTYITVNKSSNQVLSDHTTFSKNKFNLVFDEENKKLSSN